MKTPDRQAPFMTSIGEGLSLPGIAASDKQSRRSSVN